MPMDFIISSKDKSLPGKPDIVLAKYQTVIFVHGCFWHGHDGCLGWWLNKINGKIVNDVMWLKRNAEKYSIKLFQYLYK